MYLRHGTWYETKGGDAAFVRKTKGMGKHPVQGFIIVEGSPVNCNWRETGEFDWGYYFRDLDIKCRWPHHAKPKWDALEQRYLLPKGV